VSLRVVTSALVGLLHQPYHLTQAMGGGKLLLTTVSYPLATRLSPHSRAHGGSTTSRTLKSGPGVHSPFSGLSVITLYRIQRNTNTITLHGVRPAQGNGLRSWQLEFHYLPSSFAETGLFLRHGVHVLHPLLRHTLAKGIKDGQLGIWLSCVRAVKGASCPFSFPRDTPSLSTSLQEYLSFAGQPYRRNG
jgi:hypothetical protein